MATLCGAIAPVNLCKQLDIIKGSRAVELPRLVITRDPEMRRRIAAEGNVSFKLDSILW